MGVISHNRNTLPAVITSQNDILLVDYLIESPLSTDIEEEDFVENDVHVNDINRSLIIYATPRRRRIKFGTTRFLPPVGSAMQSVNKRHWGTRRIRRYENSKVFGLDFDADDICEDLSDMLPDTTTAFSQLFLEKDKMKAWNEFLHKSEEEQDMLLNQNSKIKEDQQYETDTAMATSSKHVESINYRLFSNSSNKRFSRIDKSCRFVLIHKPSVWVKLGQIETELKEYFIQNSGGSFVYQIVSAFERILIHAAAQYLDLKSMSVSDGGGGKTTEVNNIRADFYPPSNTLVSYLEERQKAMISKEMNS